MDFWEGFLLGPLWSDTDYETRRHPGQLFGIGLVCWIAMLLPVFRAEQFGVLLTAQGFRVELILFAGLALVSPLFSRYYYRCAWPLRLVLLAVQGVKFTAGMLLPFNMLLSGFELDFVTLQADAMVYIDEYLGGMIDRFTETYEGLGMIIGIVAGGLSLFAMGLGILIAALLAPRIWMALLKCVQWAWDMLLFRLLFPRIGFGNRPVTR